MRSLASLALLPLLTAATIPSTPDLGKPEGRCRSNERGPAFIDDVSRLKALEQQRVEAAEDRDDFQRREYFSRF